MRSADTLCSVKYRFHVAFMRNRKQTSRSPVFFFLNITLSQLLFKKNISSRFVFAISLLNATSADALAAFRENLGQVLFNAAVLSIKQKTNYSREGGRVGGGGVGSILNHHCGAR